MKKASSNISFMKKIWEVLKGHRTEISGFIVLLLVGIISLFTVLPIFGLLWLKLLWGGTDFFPALWFAFKATVLLLLLLPLIKWWGQSFFIRWSLQWRQEERLRFSLILLARSFGLLPMILLLPLKVLILPPKEIIWHLLYPPISSLIITFTSHFMALPARPFWQFFIISHTAPYSRPSFAISMLMLLLTFLLTSRKMAKISGLDKKFVFRRILLAVISWDLFSFLLLGLFPSWLQ